MHLAGLEQSKKDWDIAEHQITVMLADVNGRGGVFKNFTAIVDPKTFYFHSNEVSKKGDENTGGFYIQATLAETAHHELIHARDRLSLGTEAQWQAMRQGNGGVKNAQGGQAEINAVRETNKFQSDTGRPGRSSYGHDSWQQAFRLARDAGKTVPLDMAKYITPSTQKSSLGPRWTYEPTQ